MRFVVTFIVTIAVVGTWRLSGCSTPDVATIKGPVATIKGPVVSITDGDTLTVLHVRRQIPIRLMEIDAPERGQPFGKRSTESLIALCAAKMARVEWNNIDAYNRLLGRVWCDGVDANKEQVRRGMAWVYDEYVTDRGLYNVQNAAKAARLGLWSDRAHVPPWEWRRMIREQ